MDVKKLKEIEDIYKELKRKFDAGDISAEDLKADLKKMMLRDEDNRYWMLGNKSGEWYVYDGKAWNVGNPYSQENVAKPQQEESQGRQENKEGQEDREVQKSNEDKEHQEVKESKERSSDREEEKKVEAEVVILCKFCQSRLQKHDVYCNFCGGQQKGVSKSSVSKIPEGELLIKAVRIISLIFFCGGVGLIVGIIFGATFGIFKIFGDAIYQFPMMLQEMQGKIQGGLFFGALGGISGFLAFAVLGLLSGLFFNLIAYIFGGLRFKVKS